MSKIDTPLVALFFSEFVDKLEDHFYLQLFHLLLFVRVGAPLCSFSFQFRDQVQPEVAKHGGGLLLQGRMRQRRISVEL